MNSEQRQDGLAEELSPEEYKIYEAQVIKRYHQFKSNKLRDELWGREKIQQIYPRLPEVNQNKLGIDTYN